MNGKSNFGDDTVLSSTVAAATATAAIAVVGCWVIFSPSSLEHRGKNKQRHKHNNGKNKENRDCDRLRVPRRWSCMSESMAHGTFPTHTKFNEAIINAVLIFDDNDRPTMDEIVEHCVPILFQYERFSTVFDRTTNFAYTYHSTTTTTTSKEGKEEEEAKGTNANTNGGIDPYDMVRVVKVSNCLTEDDIVKELENHACVPLAAAPRGNLLPWWEFVLLENKNTSTSTSTGKSAVIWRIHHSLGDGIALVQLVQEIFTNAKTGQKLGAAAAAAASKNTTTTATNDTSKKFQIHLSPLEWVTQSFTALATVLTLPMSRFDDSTIFHKTPSPTTSVHHHPRYSSPNDMVYSSKQTIIPFMSIPLEFVKRLKTAASASASTSTSNNDTRSGSGDDVDVVVHKIKKNVTVNDVLFTIISQALHDYLKEENDIMLESKGEDLLCRALLPVALPRPKTDDKSRALRNLWCFISCDLSVGTGTTSTSTSSSGSGGSGSGSGNGSGTNQQNQMILDRLWKIHERLAILKKGLVPLVSFTVSKLVMKWLPRSISRDQTLQLFSRHSMVFSNVPGPSEPVSFANHEVLSVQMIHMNLIPQLSFLSYRGMIFGNVIVPPPTDNGYDHDEHSHNNNNSNNDDDDDDVTATMSRRRRERLPLHVSNVLVLLASKLGLQVNDVPESLRDHAAQL